MSSAADTGVLIEHRPRFASFVRSRVRDRMAAEDILQAAYARVIERAGAPTDVERLVPWFYRVLRNAIVDHYRREAADGRGRDRLHLDPTMRPETEERRRVCRCVAHALTALKPKYASILEAVEVRGNRLVDYAHGQAISSTNAAVRLHRARRLLGDELRRVCGSCTLDNCADCDCRRGESPALDGL